MSNENKYPDVDWDGDTMMVVEEGKYKCSVCGNPANHISLSFEAPFCSKKCCNSMWKDYQRSVYYSEEHDTEILPTTKCQWCGQLETDKDDPLSMIDDLYAAAKFGILNNDQTPVKSPYHKLCQEKMLIILKEEGLL